MVLNCQGSELLAWITSDQTKPGLRFKKSTYVSCVLSLELDFQRRREKFSPMIEDHEVQVWMKHYNPANIQHKKQTLGSASSFLD